MILITGGTGFIGSHLDGDVKLSSKDVDLMDLKQTTDCFKKYKPDTLIHCFPLFFISIHIFGLVLISLLCNL